MRELKYALVGKVNLRTFAVDEPASDGACHRYLIQGRLQLAGHAVMQVIEFQSGPIEGNGVNGIQMEDLLAIVMDRLEGFQRGPYKCEQNELAHDAIHEAMDHLNNRTQKRIALGKEGTHEV
jgi:hypothetical protein